MKKTIKPLLATMFLLLLTMTVLVAQEKYQYATISWASWNNNKLSVCVNGKEFTEEKIELPKGEGSVFNNNPLLTKVNEYQDKGWEVITFSSYPVGTSMCHIAYLRKK